MHTRCRILILDTDPDILIMLQQVLEEANLDATVTWDKMEASHLVKTAPFNLVLIGDHPPELNAAVILDDLSFHGTCPPVLVLRNIFGKKDAEHFRGLVPLLSSPNGIPSQFWNRSQGRSLRSNRR